MNTATLATQQKTVAQAGTLILDQLQAATRFGLETASALATAGFAQAQALIQAPSLEAGQQVLVSGMKQAQEHAQEFFRGSQALVADQLKTAEKLGQLAKEGAEHAVQAKAKSR